MERNRKKTKSFKVQGIQGVCRRWNKKIFQHLLIAKCDGKCSYQIIYTKNIVICEIFCWLFIEWILFIKWDEIGVKVFIISSEDTFSG